MEIVRLLHPGVLGDDDIEEIDDDQADMIDHMDDFVLQNLDMAEGLEFLESRQSSDLGQLSAQLQ